MGKGSLSAPPYIDELRGISIKHLRLDIL